MTAQIAIVIGLLLYLVGLLPPAFAIWRPTYSTPLAISMGVILLAVAFAQTGTLQRRTLAPGHVSHLMVGEVGSGRCGEVIDALIKARILLAPVKDSLIVNGDGWDQLPVQIQDAIVLCGQKIAGKGQADHIQVIRR